MAVILPENASAAFVRAGAEFEKYFFLVCSDEMPAIYLRTANFENDEHYTISCSDSAIEITGGRGRAVLYAVYDFFRIGFNVDWFWDGDRLPKSKQPLTPFEYSHTPAYPLRGLRYFAHRGLHRFRAEMWSESDWHREIDWLLKSGFNLFMLRIGSGDIFNRAFPDICSYPPDDCTGSESGFYDRTPYRPLEALGELRVRVCRYAESLDLERPVDCGTMTHWYSPTPDDYLNAVHPEYFSQSDNQYANKHLLVWDIRKKKNLDAYFALTDAEVRDFGGSNLFHTIGLAERLYSTDKKENFELKRSVYEAIYNHLAEKYQGSSLLLAGWDFAMYWSPDEVKQLLEGFKGKNAIAFDYTADSDDESACFVSWGVKRAFPYLTGIFHGYAPNDDIRGDYDFLSERLGETASDTFCRGVTTWQELSHGDGVLLSFLTRICRSGIAEGADATLAAYCAETFRGNEDAAEKLLRSLYPLSRLLRFRFNRTHREYVCFRDYFVSLARSEYNYNLNFFEKTEAAQSRIDFYLPQYEKAKPFFAECLKNALALYPLVADDEHAVRAMYDIARTAVARYLHFGILELQRDYFAGLDVSASCNRIYAVTERYAALLGGHSDYSAADTLAKLAEYDDYNPNFEPTFKKNLANDYSIGNCAETLCALTLPQMKLFAEGLAAGKIDEVRTNRIFEKFYETPLSMIKCLKADYCSAIRDILSLTEDKK